ncbi:MAG: histidinol-phosphatase [Treponema sp.]|nr:histidinol-phosphatase [Treponema sp.]
MKINLHTHTTFCDGNNSPQEMIEAAIEKGFSVIGFSGHSLFPFARSWHIAPGNFENYVQTINSLAEKYAEKIQVLCGFEADFFPGVSIPTKQQYELLKPDYLIGSVHYVVSEKGHYSVDNSVDKVRHNLIRLYGDSKGNIDGKRAVCEYFEAQRKMLQVGDFDILGHPDVIRKRNDILHFFDDSESWYKEELKLTAKAAASSGVVVEINTGGLARGAIKDFYPSEYFLQCLFDNGVPVCINSDSHELNTLDFAFDEAASFAKKIGYKELIYPYKNQRTVVKL